MAVASPQQSAPPGIWLRWRSQHNNNSDWHWRHKNDPTTYCGFRPKVVLETVKEWNPLRACRKCMNRISREGY